MAKRMQDKESIAGMSWLVLLIIACWGGLVRYLIDVKQSKATWSLINALAQMVVSGFTGVIAGLVSIENRCLFTPITVVVKPTKRLMLT